MSHRQFAVAATALTVAAWCATLAGAAAERTARATVARRVIRVHGAPFFPQMLIDQCSRGAVQRARRLGINLILNEGCGGVPAGRQLETLRGRQLAVLPIRMSRARGTRLLGWTYPDEPEDNGWTPARLQRTFRYRRGSPDGLLSFVTTGGGFFRRPYRDARVPQPRYREFARLADVAGFDLYPLGHCQQDLSAVYAAQRAFVRLAGRMPTFQWIETGPIRPTYCGGFTMAPAELRAEVWLAIAGGARGIGYFTHTWTPAHHSFDVSLPLQRTIRKTSELIDAVRPGLVGQTVLSGANSGAVKVIARIGDGSGATYVFAVNAERAPIRVQIHVPRLHAGRLAVFGERRAVQVESHRFVDVFNPLAVHVYVQRAR